MKSLERNKIDSESVLKRYELFGQLSLTIPTSCASIRDAREHPAAHRVDDRVATRTGADTLDSPPSVVSAWDSFKRVVALPLHNEFTILDVVINGTLGVGLPNQDGSADAVPESRSNLVSDSGN